MTGADATVDPRAAEVRRRMLQHLGVLPGAAPMAVERLVTASPAPVALFEGVDEPAVSIVIVAYGTGGVLTETLSSLAASLENESAEVIVVDNPHPDHPDRSFTELLLFTRGVLVLRPPHNLGFGGGCELGALHAGGGHLAFVNPDVTFPTGWLPPLQAVLSEHPDVSIVAPVLLDPDGSVQEVGQSCDSTGRTRPNLERPAGDELVTVDYASAACWLMRADEHERIGGFDPDYFPAYFEDLDLALRARSLGGRCVVHSGVEVVHHRGSGTPDRPKPAHAQRELLMQRWGPVIRG